MKLQQRFLEELKKASRSRQPFAEELASVLQISTDSTYRRIRGETVLSLEEVQKLCMHYRVSIDTMLSSGPEMVAFRHRPIDANGYTLLDFIKTLMRNLEKMKDAPENEILHSGKDIPLLYYFRSPEIAAFKIYFWMKSMFYYPDTVSGKFKHSLIGNEYFEVVSKVWEYYSSINSTEIWTEDSVNVTLNQIEFYHTCDFFEDPNEAAHLCDVFSQLLQEVRQWATVGIKDNKAGKLKLYKNEILFADNTVLFKVNNQRIVFIPHNMVEVISTTHESYCAQTEKDILSYVNRSVLISTTGEKERNKFFNSMDARIKSVKQRLV
jgi:hypothetical protein